MNDRLDRLRRRFERLRVDGVLVSDPVDVRYLSGFRGDDATLVVGHGAALLCTDSRFWEQVHEEVADFELSKVTSEPLLAHSVRGGAARARRGRPPRVSGGAAQSRLLPQAAPPARGSPA